MSQLGGTNKIFDVSQTRQAPNNADETIRQTPNHGDLLTFLPGEKVDDFDDDSGRLMITNTIQNPSSSFLPKIDEKNTSS